MKLAAYSTVLRSGASAEILRISTGKVSALGGLRLAARANYHRPSKSSMQRRRWPFRKTKWRFGPRMRMAAHKSVADRERGAALRHSGRLLGSLEMRGEAISASKKPTGRSAERSARTAAPPLIPGRENRWLKLFRAALHDGYLADENLIGIEGPHLIGEAQRARLIFEACLASPVGEKHLASLATAANASTRILRTSERVFNGVAATEHPQGIAALVRPRESTFGDLLRGDHPLVVVLAGLQDPGNVGTVVRSAEAFGATGLAATRGTADPWSAKALRASAGSALRLPLLRGMAPAVLMAQLRSE